MDKEVLVVVSGGLANRMRAIMSGISLSRDCGCGCRIVWMPLFELNASYGTLFDPGCMPVRLWQPGRLDYALRFEVPRKRNLYLSGIYQRIRYSARLVHATSDVHYPATEVLRGMVRNGRGGIYVFSGIDFYPFSCEEYREVFKLSPTVEKRVGELMAGGRPRVAVHVRRTDNALSVSHSPLELFEDAVRREIEADPSAVVYVASDDQSAKMHMAREFPDNVVFNPRPARRDTAEGIVDALAEMALMGTAERIYGSYWSTYSEAASILGGAELVVLRRRGSAAASSE